MADIKTFEESAKRSFDHFLEDVKSLQEKPEDEEEGTDAFFQRILSDEKITRHNITLGTGGPASGLFIDIEGEGRDREITRIAYWYQDWFQPKKLFELEGEEFDVLAGLFDYLTEEDRA